ncbi:MAG: helix-turn-helix domain-containing protein [Chloroflexi bacterium]|nr:helix-turn-helix domain-containing protein [Chloroflexota bacterium]
MPISLTRILSYSSYTSHSPSRQQILDAVWGYGPEVESEDVIKVNIRRLREKIELDPGSPKLLLTVPGIGYRLVV